MPVINAKFAFEEVPLGIEQSIAQTLTAAETGWMEFDLASGTVDQLLPVTVTDIDVLYITSDQQVTWRLAVADTANTIKANRFICLWGTNISQFLLSNAGSSTAKIKCFVAGNLGIAGSPGIAPLLTLVGYLEASLPAAGTVGRLAFVTNNARNIQFDTGVQWYDLMAGVANFKRFNARGDNSTNDTSALQDAVDAANVVVVQDGGTFRFTSLNLRANTKIAGLRPTTCVLRSTHATANGLVIPEVNTSVHIENLTLDSVGSSSGTGIYGATTSLANPMRETILRNLYIDGFKNGVELQNCLSVAFENVRLNGQGKTVVGGVGIRLGDAAGTYPGNVAHLSKPYLNNFETGIRSIAHAVEINTPTVELGIYGIQCGRRTLITNPYITTDTYHFETIAPDGAFFVLGNPESSAAPKVNHVSAASRAASSIWPIQQSSNSPVRMGDLTWTNGRVSSITRIRAHRTANQTGVTSGTPNEVLLTTAQYDELAEWNTSTSTFTPAALNLPDGWYSVRVQATFSSIPANTQMIAFIYRAGSEFSRSQPAYSSSAGASDAGVGYEDLVFVAAGQTLKMYVQHNAGTNQTIIGTGTQTFMTIHKYT